MAKGCVVCGEGGWAGSKLGSHKICISCYRKGYRFGKVVKGRFSSLGWASVLKPNGSLLKDVRVRV